LLITSPVTAPAAIERLALLAKKAPTTIATVDDPGVARRIDAALDVAGATLEVLVDIDPGIHRTGVASPAAAVELALTIQGLPNLRYRGVQFYCGAQQHIADYAERRAAIVERTDYLKQVIEALAGAGFPPEIVTGSGTGTHHIDMELGVFTEYQAGSYIFMDQQYLDCDLTGAGSDCPPFVTALAVDARVVSANHDALVTIDAGYKSLSTDGGVAVVQRGPGEGATFAFMGDEHAALIVPGIAKKLRQGDPVSLTVPHCDPTVNLYDFYHVIQGDTLVDIWPVSARGRAR
jgi:D-serine deaminase-like pyridoxal phosphate-dependent protein